MTRYHSNQVSRVCLRCALHLAHTIKCLFTCRDVHLYPTEGQKSALTADLGVALLCIWTYSPGITTVRITPAVSRFIHILHSALLFRIDAFLPLSIMNEGRPPPFYMHQQQLFERDNVNISVCDDLKIVALLQMLLSLSIAIMQRERPSPRSVLAEQF